MTVTTEVMHAEASSLVLIDDETEDMLFHVARGEKASAIKPIRMKQGEGIVGWVIQNNKSVVVNNVDEDQRFFRKVDEESGFKTKSILCVPLESTDRLWGAIEVLNKVGGGNFNDHDLVFCEAIACLAAIAIENAMLHEKIVKTERLTAIGLTISGLAHCIKNVLNGILGGSYMVDLGLKNNDQEKMIKGWSIVKKNNVFIQNLVLDMLTYSKAREPEYEITDINDIIESVCSLMTAKAREKDVNITYDANPHFNEVILDSKGIRRCLLNLVSNAVDACEKSEKGCVSVSVETIDEEKFRIKVADNGCGITDEGRKKLFQMFYSTKGSKGTGLGLAVTHKIITEHKGRIDVDSVAGKGTDFIITLPVRIDYESS